MKRKVEILGLALGAIFLAVAFSQVSWADFFSAISSVDYRWVAVTAVALLAAMLLRALRWHLITGLRRGDFSKVWESACIGYIGTAIYPARAGDVLRIVDLQRSTGIGGGLAIGSGAVDRIVDGLALCSLVLVVLVMWAGDLQAQQGFLWLGLVFFVAACGGVLFILQGHRLRVLFERLNGLGKMGARLSVWYEQCLSGLQILRHPRRLLMIFLVQVVISYLDVLACWLLFLAFGWNMSFSAAVVVLIYLAAAISLPSSPGYVGVYQIAALFALKAFDIGESLAVAYGTLLHVLNLALFVGVGIWAYLKRARAIHVV